MWGGGGPRWKWLLLTTRMAVAGTHGLQHRSSLSAARLMFPLGGGGAQVQSLTPTPPKHFGPLKGGLGPKTPTATSCRG